MEQSISGYQQEHPALVTAFVDFNNKLNNEQPTIVVN